MRERLATLILGERPEGQLPARVQDAIARREAQAERLIGWAQLSVGLIWSSLYYLAPRAIESARFEPAPVALGVYVAFTALRLWLTYRTETPAWFLALSVVVDMALLMGLIWSFHLQYQQPAAFYLKAPTLLYVFIFIACARCASRAATCCWQACRRRARLARARLLRGRDDPQPASASRATTSPT
jgi:adenylate cyclase